MLSTARSHQFGLLFCHLLFIYFRFVIWVFPTVAEGTVIPAAVKPDSQDRQSNQGTAV